MLAIRISAKCFRITILEYEGIVKNILKWESEESIFESEKGELAYLLGIK